MRSNHRFKWLNFEPQLGSNENTLTWRMPPDVNTSEANEGQSAWVYHPALFADPRGIAPMARSEHEMREKG